MARDAGLSSAYISRLEAVEEIDVTLPTFTAIFEALGVPPGVSRRIFDGEVSPKMRILEDGSVEDRGVIYSSQGGTVLPSGSRIEGRSIVLPDGRAFIPEDGIELASPSVLDENGRLPDGATLYSDGTIRVPGEPTTEGVTWQEAEILGRFRRIPSRDRALAGRVLLKVIEAFAEGLSEEERAQFLRRKQEAQIGLTPEDRERTEEPHITRKEFREKRGLPGEPEAEPAKRKPARRKLKA